ncbi:MAG: lipid-A-disaccharide synthase [Pirellulales bacterium]|nr:lipid-A-disaccharide synthase [Pirellulales bacterium]
MRVFFSVGEPSGDLHGGNLISALRERNADWQFVGYGGPRMAAAGCQLHAELTQLAFMGVFRVLVHLREFLKLIARADAYFDRQRPDLVVLIDFPGFNWWVARKAKARGIPVVYYGTPQLWAWASWRVRKMRSFVDHVLCKLPFEEAWFRKRGCHATFVGHPYFDELTSRRLDESFVARLNDAGAPMVTILPGSRDQEIKNNLPTFLRAAGRIRQQVPNARFAVAVYKASQRDMVEHCVRRAESDVEVYVDCTAELIHTATCCMACSGSVSLELLFHAKPSVILYRISRPWYFVQWMLRKVRYITLVNLLTADDPFADRSAGIYAPDDPRDQHVLMPEYLTCSDRSAELARHMVEWLTDEKSRSRVQGQLMDLKARVAHGGASQRGAAYISEIADGRSTVHAA